MERLMSTLPTDPPAAEAQDRAASIDALRAAGVNPYPAAAFPTSMPIGRALLEAHDLIRLETDLRFAGRVSAVRRLGRACFIDILHDNERLQILASVADLTAGDLALLPEIDIGDFIGCEGRLFLTRRGETTLRAVRLRILSKALLCPPIGKRSAHSQVHQALNDTGRLLRERHVALLTDSGLRQRLIQRDRIIREIRNYLHDEGFIEVETPVLSHAYSGAAAKPFVTRSNAVNGDVYLRVAPECYLKRALCGGLSKIFEIGKNFRNEGVDHSHNPEFTALEWYEAYSDYQHQMKRFETLVWRLVNAVQDTGFVRFRGRMLDFSPPWPRLRVTEAVAEAIDVTPEQLTLETVQRACLKLDLQVGARMSWGEGVMALFEQLVEPQLWGPVFVIDHPVEISPLTKLHRADSRLVERFEPYAGGMEIGNAYSELNDPIEQRRRLLDQDQARDDCYGVDENFLRAIEHGMPPTGGAGMGIDRVVMLLTGAERLSDIILFPAG
jgi:lysyl-tRNA synthetase class 2